MEVIEGLFVTIGSNVCWINLTHRYVAQIDEEKKQITIVKNRQNVYSVPQVASFTALFGINGSGKTQLLLELAESCSGYNGCKMGILISREGNQPQLYKGKVLKSWSSNVELTRPPTKIDTIFYSSSPFDMVRRRSYLNKKNVIDTSPRFNHNMQYDIVFVMETMGWLKHNIAAYKNIELSIQNSIPDVYTSIENILSLLVTMSSKAMDVRRRDFKTKLRYLFQRLKEDADAESVINARLYIAKLTNLLPENPLRNKFIEELSALLMSKPEIDTLHFYSFIKIMALDSGTKLSLENVGPILKGVVSLKTRNKVIIPEVNLLPFVNALNDFEKDVLREMVEEDVLRYEFTKISSGEIALLQLFLSIGAELKNHTEHDNSPIMIMIDEGEMFLHPAWQKKYIAQLLAFCQNKNNIAHRIHLFVSTHSLIVAADSPPFCLFDMNKGHNINGFGLGPKSILYDVYNAGEFSGEYSASLFNKIMRYIRIAEEIKPEEIKPEEIMEARTLIDSLADDTLKATLKRKVFGKES
ncbi:AAA family ATPase [Pantoea ananatis]|uniref:AAA family ATPase n=1 Tax=Pantoea ananas TaxID=553 RepID=UPI0024AC8569|nr:AAA family ATPase [Pantoea ananatis]MDI6535861.1 AAA family ATPase [Pantoea ananatis]